MSKWKIWGSGARSPAGALHDPTREFAFTESEWAELRSAGAPNDGVDRRGEGATTRYIMTVAPETIKLIQALAEASGRTPEAQIIHMAKAKKVVLSSTDGEPRGPRKEWHTNTEEVLHRGKIKPAERAAQVAAMLSRFANDPELPDALYIAGLYPKDRVEDHEAGTQLVSHELRMGLCGGLGNHIEMLEAFMDAVLQNYPGETWLKPLLKTIRAKVAEQGSFSTELVESDKATPPASRGRH